MALLVATSLQGPGPRAMTKNVASASDTFTFEPGDLLMFDNVSAGSLTPLVDGAGGTTWPAGDGLGADVTVSAGLSIGAIPAGQQRIVPCDTIRAYLQGLTTITGFATGAIYILRR